ncbi:MAG: YncE family protein [Thermoplasmata archaeon]
MTRRRVTLGVLLVLALAVGAWTFGGIGYRTPATIERAGDASIEGSVRLAPTVAVPLLTTVESVELGNSTHGNSPDPPVYDSQNGFVYIPNFNTRNLTVVHGLSIVASVVVAGNPTSALFDPDNGFVYVAMDNASAGNGSALAVVNGTSVIAEIPTGNCSGPVVYDPSNGYVYAADECVPNATVVHGTSVVAHIGLPAAGATRFGWGASYDPGNGYVYFSDGEKGVLYAVNGTSYVGSVTTGGWPIGGTFDPNDGLFYVTDTSTGNLSVLRGLTIVATLSFGGTQYADGTANRGTFDSANGLLYVPFFQGGLSGNATVAVFNGTSELTTLNVGPLISGSTTYAQYGNDTGFIYENSGESLNGGLGAGTLTAIGGTTILGSLNYSSEPAGSVYDPVNGLVYLATRTPSNLATGLITDFLYIVACNSCNAVTVTESGVADGASWGVQVSNSSSQYAATANAVAPSPVTLRLLDGTYSLRIVAPGGASIQVASANADYNQTSGTIRVGVVPPPPPGGGGGPGSFSSLPWPLFGIFAGLAGAVVVAVAIIRRDRLRSEGEELVEGMRNVISEGAGPRKPA